MRFEINRFEILVEPKEYFKNGDRVSCILIIEVQGYLKCKHIFMTAIGELFAKFNKEQRYHKRTRFMTIPFNLRDLVKCNGLDTGVYRIPFDFHLTNAILPTFRIKNGHVIYFIEAIVDTGLFTGIEYETRVEIKVKSRSNVCSTVSYYTPVASDREILIRVFGIKVGPVRLSAHLDKDIFNCNEKIYMNFHLNNRSTKMIRLFPQLVQITTFKYEYLILDSEKLMFSNYAEICPEFSSQSDIVCIQIPFDTISTIRTDLLEINYFIKLYVDIAGGAEYFDSLPILIR